MEAIILVGIPGSGKSTYYHKHFMNSHARISLDLLGTRSREKKFVKLCIETQMPLVIDNTNVTKKSRQLYMQMLKNAGYEIKCIYFKLDKQVAIERNSQRIGKARVPDVAIHGMYSRLEEPAIEEGFNEIIRVE